jgi:hypothetical protein
MAFRICLDSEKKILLASAILEQVFLDGAVQKEQRLVLMKEERKFYWIERL